MTRPALPALPQLPTLAVPSLPSIARARVSVQLPSREAVVRTAKAALPWLLITGELGLLLLPLVAPYLAPALAAQLLALAPYLAAVLGLVA